MHNLNHRREFNYDDYIGLSSVYGNWGIGLQYIKKSIERQAWVLTQGQGIQLGQIDKESTWLQIGGSFILSFFSVGANLRFLKQTNEISCELVNPPIYQKNSDSAMGFDIGFLTEFGPICEQGIRRMFSVGFLVQDLNKPELLGEQYITNFRPGLGFRPLDNLLFSLEIYDAAHQYFHQPQVRIGSEWVFSTPYFTGDVALRGGVYHLNGNNYRAFTGGVGYLRPFSGNFSLGIDYAFMCWEKQKKITHLLSFIFKFK